MRMKRGQSVLEYIILVVVIIAALLTMQVYLKRGIQGRMKASVDDLGDQYDPRKTNVTLLYQYNTNSKTEIEEVDVGSNRIETQRIDATGSIETKLGNTVTDLGN